MFPQNQAAETGDGGQGRKQDRPARLDILSFPRPLVGGKDAVPEMEAVIAAHADDGHQHHGIHEIEAHAGQRQ